MRFTPFLYLSGGGSVVHYITGAEMPGGNPAAFSALVCQLDK
ncbi:hypothetical protein ACLWSN_001750 [Campylobacter jejuni]